MRQADCGWVGGAGQSIDRNGSTCAMSQFGRERPYNAWLARTSPKSGGRMKTGTRRTLMHAMVIAAALGSGNVPAKTCNGINFPDQLQVDGSNLPLNGLGLYQATILKVKVYVAALYVGKTSADPNAILAAGGPSGLVLQFVRDVGANDLRKGWDEGFAENSSAQLPALKERIAMLNGWMADMKSGQRLAFIHKPGAGVQVDVNGTVKGTIKGDDFAKALLAIWLGGEPPNAEIKAGMLGGACG